MDDLNRKLLIIEKEIDEKRAEQNKLIAAAIGKIQKMHGCTAKVEIEMDYEETDSYHACVRNYGDLHPSALDEIDNLLFDYSFVFAGKYGVGRIDPAYETIEFTT